MASESDGSELFSHDPSGIDYCAPLRPQIQALHVETVKDRFPANKDFHRPRVATWRSNLAAASQRRNLLFVASGSEINVWAPSGPFALLGSQPQMIINPVMKTPSADGYIDRSNPHTINAILVDDLGRDEVLLLATDSGNVCGYHVEVIYSALARCKEEKLQRPFDGTQVSPFFTEDVGMSAWGLATHKFARLIAVSSNTGQITVYAFALVGAAVNDDTKSQPSQPQISQDRGLLSDQTWVSINNRKQLRALRELMPHNHRSRNLRLTYRGHFDNIPHVSFANFDLDANGIWMVSTDISNRVIIWRLWDDLWPSRVYSPGDPSNNPPQRGWAVLPLDPRTFKHHKRRVEACGCQPMTEEVASRTLLDVSKAIEEITDATQLVEGTYKAPKPVINHCLPDDLVFSEECIGEDRSRSPIDVGQGSLRASDLDPEERGGRVSPTSSIGSEYANCGFSPNPRTRSLNPLVSLFEEDNSHFRVTPYVFPGFGRNLVTTFDGLHNRPVHPQFPDFFPVIHFSERTISLAPYPMDSEYHLVCRNALFQAFRSFDISIHFDRFNMVKSIPELGLVVAASQKGRVAIISLTWQEEVGYSFRLDWIVPFFTQEQKNERPEVPLLGLAVSPVPGFEIPQDVPHIPRGVDPDDWLEFNYRILDQDESDDSSSHFSSRPSSPTQNPTTHSAAAPSADFNPFGNPFGDSDTPSESEKSDLLTMSDNMSEEENPKTHTLPELHAEAFRAYRPQEDWHGWHPSRHYRLLLLFCDHTVMSYEFWHDWKAKATA